MDKARKKYYMEALSVGKTHTEMARELGISRPAVSIALKGLNHEIEAQQESEMLARIRSSRSEYDVISEAQALAQLWTGKVHVAEERDDHKVYGRLALDAMGLLSKLRREMVDMTEARVDVRAEAVWTEDDEREYRELVDES